ncbi:MAG: nitrogen fixation protein NifQ, partial [Desulfuromonadales bacterium]|nr:nitrogen fixation protein NifQ [Desulfuromonadales bacterium]
VYSQLMQRPQPESVSYEDRHLFACLIAVAAQESADLATPLGLGQRELDSLLLLLFPGQSRELLVRRPLSDNPSPAQSNPEVLKILLSHVPPDNHFQQDFISLWLAQILATRVSLPGHLWVAMGLTERPQLTAAIRRHLPDLAQANSQNMRWKRYLYKQICDLNGGVMCKAPNCGVCSDYHLCFAEEDSD